MSLSYNKTDRSAKLTPPMGDAEWSRLFWVTFFLALLGTTSDSKVQAYPTSVNSFEGPTTSWKIEETDSAVQVLNHSRVRRPVHSGSWAEKFHLFSPGGSFAYAGTAIEMASVIDELSFSVWIRADRPGLQLAARVVLPRSIDPKTGRDLTLKIYGNSYQNVGRWQQVFLDEIVHKVRQQARVAQSGQQGKVDAREAYIDRILINLHGGRGETTAFIDDLTSQGLITRQAEAEKRAVASYESSSLPAYPNKMRTGRSSAPAVPRTIEYQGEPFAFLQDLGFNAVLLRKPPTDQQRLEAGKYRLWLLGPAASSAKQASQLSTEGPGKGPLLWYEPVSNNDLPEALANETVERSPPIAPPHLTSSVLPSAMKEIFTQISPTSECPLPLEEAFDDVLPSRVDLAYQEIRGQVLRKIAKGKRHFLFASRTPLNDPHAASRRRCKALQLILIELDLLAPFLSGSTASQTIQSSHPDIQATLLKKNRVSLVIPICPKIHGTYITRPVAESHTLIVPNTSATSRTFLMSPFDLRPVYRQRVAGGIQVELRRIDQTSVLLMTTHAPTIRRTAQQIAGIKSEAQSLFHWLLEEETRLYRTTYQQLQTLRLTEKGGDPLLDIAPVHRLENSPAPSNRRHHQLEEDLKAYQKLCSAHWKLWQTATTALGPPTRRAPLARFDTLPEAIAWTKFTANASLGRNLLGGSLTDQKTATVSGWKLVTAAETGPDAGFEVIGASNGKDDAIHLWARRKKDVPGGTASLVLESPSLTLPIGQPYVLQAEVTVKPLEASGKNTLLIFDSGQGIVLAERFNATAPEQKCMLYRRSPPNGQLTISIALEGSLEVWIKNLTVRQLLDSKNPAQSESTFFLATPKEP